MKGFLLFLAGVLVLIALGAGYYITHPSETIYVKRGGSWVAMEQNLSAIKPVTRH